MKKKTKTLSGGRLGSRDNQPRDTERQQPLDPLAKPSTVMPSSHSPIRRIKPDDVPFSPDMAEVDLDSLVDHAVFHELDPSFRTSPRFRKILRIHARIVECNEGDIIVREGDWGNSAFFILSGEVAVEIEAPGEFLSDASLGRYSSQRKNLFQAIAQLWRNHREPEYRDASVTTWNDDRSATRSDGIQIYLQDVPRLLNDFGIVRLQEGQLFGELAALGRTARTATVFALGKPTLLEIRWQGLRDLIKKDTGLRKRIDRKFRENALKTFLRASPLLQHLDDIVLDEFVGEAQLETYGEFDSVGSFRQKADEGVANNLANEPLIAEEGHYPNGMILIRSGVARVSRRHHNGHQTISYLTPGKIFGFEEIRRGIQTDESVPFEHSLRAIGFMSVIVIPTQLVRKHMSQEDELRPARIGRRQRRHRDLSAGDVSFVEPDFVEFLAQERFVNGTATMLINLDRCTRCDDCVRACATAHDNNPRFLRQGPVHANFMVARACMHCQDPVCMIECPTGAISRRLDGGEVTINDSTCIGCGACAKNCPYDAIRMVEIRDAQGNFIRTTKDRKPIPKATKCDLCVDQQGGPACQRACPHDALARIDMSNVDSLTAWLHQ